MEITDDMKNLATVARLNKMISEIPETEYTTTLTYALFSTILCWTIQSLRQKDRFMQEEWRALESESINSMPWNIRTAISDLTPPTLPIFPAFSEFSVSRFVVALRNAVAHGDGRRIFPDNKNGRLIGYIFRCVEEDRQKDKVTFEGDISLSVIDMVRIGKELSGRHARGVRFKIGYPVDGAISALRERRPPHMNRRNLNRG